MIEVHSGGRLRCLKYNANGRKGNWHAVDNFEGDFNCCSLFQPLRKKSSQYRLVLVSCIKPQRIGLYAASLQKVTSWKGKFKQHFPFRVVRFFVGVILVMSVSVVVSRTPSCK